MMKRTFSTIILLPAFAVATSAQTLNIQTSGVTYLIPASEAGDMVYTGGETLTVMGKTLNVSDISKMYVCDNEVSDNSVSVTYNGTEACVTISGNVARYVSASVSGAHVSLVQSDDVSDDTCGEITYSLSGASTDGAFALTGSYKASIELNGLSLTNPTGAALDIQDGKRIAVSVKKGTENKLTDGTGGSQKGCITCKGHLEMKGKGTLNVYGNTGHAIFSKEYFSMKNCTLSVLSAVKDGINSGQYFLLESGALSISGVGDDGVQVSYKDDTDREADDTGALTITGGTVNISLAAAAAAKGMKAEGLLTISGGDITVTTSAGGTWDSDENKTKASSCLSSDADILISGGTLSLTSTGAGGKGINGDGTLTISDGDITVNTSGGLYAYVNGKEYTNYTGSTDRLGSDYKSSPKGIKIDGDVTISGGTVNVTTTGNGGEGIESKAVLTITGGTVVGNAYDDVINSGSHMYIKGGDITVVASNNDGLDANGNMYIQGGTIRAFGTSAPECGIDANEEGGYSVFFTGGTLLAVGGGNSVPSSSLSTQAYVSGNLSVTSGGTVSLMSGSTTLASFAVPASYSSSSSSGGMGGRMGGFGGQGGPGGPGGQGGPGGGGMGGSSVLITLAGLTSGSSYTLTNGSSSTTVTAKK